jgi:hypothetical protein
MHPRWSTLSVITVRADRLGGRPPRNLPDVVARTQMAVVAMSMIVSGAVAACANGERLPASAPPPQSVVVAESLAVSQVSATTVARPAAPPPCDPAVLSFAAAPISTTEALATTIRVVNNGDAWCEVDVSDSPNVDPLMEPSVWLEPGAAAELLAESVAEGCSVSDSIRSIALVANGRSFIVPIEPVAACGVLLIAVYPL